MRLHSLGIFTKQKDLRLQKAGSQVKMQESLCPGCALRITNLIQPAAVALGIPVRHFSGWRKKHLRYERSSRKCGRRKALYMDDDWPDRTSSAKMRSREEAGRFSQAERDRRVPAPQRLREIEEQEAHKATLQQTQDNTNLDAAERWKVSQRPISIETAK
jgi:hypothetical protein